MVNKRRVQTWSQFNESIKAKEATTAYDSLMSLLPLGFEESDWTGGQPPIGRRRVCFFTRWDLKPRDWSMMDMILRLGFKMVEVKGENDAVIFYHPTAKDQAMELKAIAERHRGYLSKDATEQETRRIGQLLEYDPADIEEHIRKNYGPVRESRDWAVWLTLAAAMCLGSPARSEAPSEVAARVVAMTDSVPDLPMLDSAKRRVKEKVMTSRVILNKEDLCRRIDDVEVREYRVMMGSGVLMYYTRDPKTDKDYIFVNKVHRMPHMELSTLVHELNHLVHERQLVKKPTAPGQVLMKISPRDYERYFERWPMVKPTRGRKAGEPMTIGRKLAGEYVRMGGYLLSEFEAQARLSSLKDFLIRQGLMTRTEALTKAHVDKMVEWARGLGDEEYRRFLLNDFILVLPLIDWRCVEEIDLFAGRGSRGSSVA
jgi:hypothetical protein